MSEGTGIAWLPPRLTARLRQLGYDIEATGDAAGESLIARRDLGARVILVALDRGGRFRIEITREVGERAARDEIAGVPVRIVATTTRTAEITGQVDEPTQLIAVVAAVEAMLGWGDDAGTPTAGDSC